MDIKEANDPKEVEKIYPLYQMLFPVEDERETVDNLKKYLTNINSSVEHFSYFIIYAEENNYPIGILIGDYFKDSHTRIIEYVGVAPEWRKKGIAKKLIDKFFSLCPEDEKGKINGTFIEVEDPLDERNKKESSTPFWDLLGYEVVQLRYICPPLSEGKKPATNLILMYKSELGETLEPLALMSFLESYFKYSMPYENPRSRPEFELIEKQLKWKLKVRTVKLKDYLQNGLLLFEDPVIAKISTISFFPSSLRHNVKQELFNFEIEKFSQYFSQEILHSKLVSIDVLQLIKGGGTDVKNTLLNIGDTSNPLLELRKLRDNNFNGEYLRNKIALKGVLHVNDFTGWEFKLKYGTVKGIEMDIILELNHLGIMTLTFVFYMNGIFSTDELIYLYFPDFSLDKTDNIKILTKSTQNIEIRDILNEIFESAQRSIQDLGSENYKFLKIAQSRFFPFFFANCIHPPDKNSELMDKIINKNLYGLSNLDNTWEKISDKYVKYIVEGDIAILEGTYAYYGKKIGFGINWNKLEDILKAVTAFDNDDIPADYSAILSLPLKTRIMNEYLSEVESLLIEKIYLENMKELLSNISLKKTSNEKTGLKELMNIERTLQVQIEEFNGLSMHGYIDLDIALEKGRKTMGIKDLYGFVSNEISVISRRLDFAYRLKNDQGISLLSYLLAFFTVVSVEVGLEDFTLGSKAITPGILIYLLLPPLFAIMAIYVWSNFRRGF